jgi:hypothetical protein
MSGAPQHENFAPANPIIIITNTAAANILNFMITVLQYSGLWLWAIATVLEFVMLAICAVKIRVTILTVLSVNAALAEVCQWAAFLFWPSRYSDVNLLFNVVVAISLMATSFSLAAKFAPQLKGLISVALLMMLSVFVVRVVYVLNQPIAEQRIRTFSSICMAISCAFLMSLLMFKPSRYEAGEQYKWLCWSVGILAGLQVVLARFRESFPWSVTVSRARQLAWIVGVVCIIVSSLKFKDGDKRESWRNHE